MRALSVAAVVVAMSLSVAAAEAQAVSVAQVPDVHVIGNDYAFLHPPDTVAAGQTTFSFENHGTVRHELSLALLGESMTLRAVLDAFSQGAPRRGMLKSIGVLIAAPNDTSGGRLLATLIPGRTYTLVCTLRDKPDAQQHVMLGMISAFFVKP
jgi:hypothetical protein